MKWQLIVGATSIILTAFSLVHAYQGHFDVACYTFLWAAWLDAAMWRQMR